jgi:hypothetical protein
MAGNDKYPVYRVHPQKGYCYPFDVEMLFPSLDQYGIEKIHSVAFRHQSRSKELISAIYHGELARDRIKEFHDIDVQPEQERVWGIGVSDIKLYSTPIEEKESARKVLVDEAIPLLCQWLKEAEKQTYNWRRNDHNIIFKFSKGHLYHAMDVERYS